MFLLYLKSILKLFLNALNFILSYLSKYKIFLLS